MRLLKLVLSTDFLLFILGVHWSEISMYIQTKLAKCNPVIFNVILAVLLFALLQEL